MTLSKGREVALRLMGVSLGCSRCVHWIRRERDRVLRSTYIRFCEKSSCFKYQDDGRACDEFSLKKEKSGS